MAVRGISVAADFEIPVDTALKVGAVEQSQLVSAQELTLETESGEMCSQITTASIVRE